MSSNPNKETEPGKGVLNFVDAKKDPRHYIKRYLGEPDYKAWFERNYPDYTIYEAVGLSEIDFHEITEKLTIEPEVIEPIESEVKPEHEKKVGFFKSKVSGFGSKLKSPQEQEAVSVQETSSKIETEPPKEVEVQNKETPELAKPVVESLLDRVSDYEGRKSHSFEDFVDEQLLISRDALGKKEMKIKVLEVSDENPPLQWKLGDRVKINKILITIKHLQTQEVEEGELDIESVEKELIEKRHYTSTNRWVPTNDVKNGYVIGGRHISLISDAIALDYIIF